MNPEYELPQHIHDRLVCLALEVAWALEDCS